MHRPLHTAWYTAPSRQACTSIHPKGPTSRLSASMSAPKAWNTSSISKFTARPALCAAVSPCRADNDSKTVMNQLTEVIGENRREPGCLTARPKSKRKATSYNHNC
jgi:hypothetical protein